MMEKLKSINNRILKKIAEDTNVSMKDLLLFYQSNVITNVGDIDVKELVFFEKIVEDTIESSNNEFGIDILNELLISLSLDNETGLVLEVIKKKLSKSQLNMLIILGLNHSWKETRFNAIEMLFCSEIQGKENLYFYILLKEKQVVLIRMALYYLFKLNKEMAKIIASNIEIQGDEYLEGLVNEIMMN